MPLPVPGVAGWNHGDPKWLMILGETIIPTGWSHRSSAGRIPCCFTVTLTIGTHPSGNHMNQEMVRFIAKASYRWGLLSRVFVSWVYHWRSHLLHQCVNLFFTGGAHMHHWKVLMASMVTGDWYRSGMILIASDWDYLETDIRYTEPKKTDYLVHHPQSGKQLAIGINCCVPECILSASVDCAMHEQTHTLTMDNPDFVCIVYHLDIVNL